MKTDDALSRAQDWQRRGVLDDASRLYRSVLAAEPDNADALYGLGGVHLQGGDPREARPLLRRAAELMPDVPEFAFNLALAEEACGDRKEALHLLIRAGRLAGQDSALLARVAGKLASLGQHRAVLALVSTSGSADPALLALAARAQARLGDWAGACANLRSVVRRRPDDAAALRRLATAAGHLRDYATALSAFERYLGLTEARAADQVAYADLLLMARRAEQAAAAVARARALGADGADVEFIAARCARLAGDYADAVRCLRRAVAERPAFGNAWWLLVDLVDEDGALDELAQTCHDLVEAATTRPRDAVLLSLSAGRASERLGRFEQAFADFQLGKDRQRALLESRGTAYDRAATESFVVRMARLYAAAPPRQAPGPISPVFIVGLPRSGTTVVERMLASLESVEAGGENEAMEFVASRYYWDLEHGRMPPPAALDEPARESLREDYWQRTGGTPRRVTDKLPHNFRNAGLIAHVFPDAPIVHLHRDPRDVAVSIYSRPFPDGHAYACDLEALGHFVAQAERLHAHWRQVMPERILDVQYEELVREPEPVTRRIAEFCGLRWDPACLAFHQQPDAAFTFSEMQVREALNDRGVGRWRRYQAQLQPFVDAWQRSRP